MALLDQTNPHATPKSVMIHSIGWAIVTTVAYCLACLWNPTLRETWFVKVLGCLIFGAAIGGLMEWQLDDSDDEDDV